MKKVPVPISKYSSAVLKTKVSSTLNILVTEPGMWRDRMGERKNREVGHTGC
jgi:hypothetical protein